MTDPEVKIFRLAPEVADPLSYAEELKARSGHYIEPEGGECEIAEDQRGVAMDTKNLLGS